MRGRTYQANFTMGELSRDLLGRVDLAAYVAGAKTFENMIPAVTGAARRRPGFLDEGAPKAQNRFWRGVPFQRSIEDRLWLEFGHLYVRFWNPDGSQVLSGGVPYEIVSPYSEGDLAGLDFTQSNDVFFITAKSGLIPPYVLVRSAATSWAFAEPENVNGPWLPENADDDFTIAADGSAVGATITLTASKPLFQAGHVGGLFRLREQIAGASVGGWAVEYDLHETNEAILSDGKVYASPTGAASDSKTGANQPVHESGTASDGYMTWTYIHDGAGIVRIAAVASATSATAEVIARLPTPGVAGASGRVVINPAGNDAFGPSPYWAECAWSDYRGWPRKVSETDEERLAFGGTLLNPGFIALTRTGGFSPTKLDFHPGQGTGRVTDDDAITRTVAAGGDPILWLRMAAYLMVGTSSREYALVGETVDRPLTPAGNQLKRLTETGSREVEPVVAYDALLHVPRGGRGLNMVKLLPDGTQDDDDLALFAEDQVAPRIAGMAWAAKPHSTCWIWTDSGELLSLVYHPKQKVFGFQRHPLPGGFTVEWAWVLHDAEGYDVLWLAVKRTKSGSTQRRVWRLAPRWREGDPQASIIYLDAAKIYSGASTTTISGLSHLASEEVIVFGDGGSWIEHVTVSSGGVATVTQAVSDAVVGLEYDSLVEVMPIDMAGPAGSIGQLQRPTDVYVHATDFMSAAVRFGAGPWEELGGEPYVDDPAAPRTDFHKGKVGGSTTREATVSVKFSGAWPGTLLAIGSMATAND